MSRTFRCLLIPLISLVVASAALPAAQASGSAVLGNGGELFVARTGTFGELFPGRDSVPAARPVLTVDRIAPDQPTERLLVPGTGDAVTERSPTLLYEKSSQTLYVIWEGMRDPTVSALLLASLNDGGWSEPVEISGDISPLKGEPQVLISTDQLTVPGHDGPVERDRTLLHIVWWEESDGFEETYFTPVVLDGGVYVGWNPVFRLNDLDTSEPLEGAGVPRSLLRSPRITVGGDLHAAVIGFADGHSGRFSISETRLLPPELGAIADDIRSQIIEIGRSDAGSDLGSLYDKIRSQIIEIGHELNHGAVNHFANQCVAVTRDTLDQGGDRPIDLLADEIRSQIIEIGARTLVDLEAASTAAPDRVIEIAPREDAPEGVAAATHLVRLRLVSARPAPAVPEGPVEIYLSEDGQRALVSWTGEDSLYYTETAGADAEGSWTTPRRLALDEALGASQAEQVLRRRVSRRP